MKLKEARNLDYRNSYLVKERKVLENQQRQPQSGRETAATSSRLGTIIHINHPTKAF